MRKPSDTTRERVAGKAKRTDLKEANVIVSVYSGHAESLIDNQLHTNFRRETKSEQTRDCKTDKFF